MTSPRLGVPGSRTSVTGVGAPEARAYRLVANVNCSLRSSARTPPGPAPPPGRESRAGGRRLGGWGSPNLARIRSGTSPIRLGCWASNWRMIAARSACVISATRSESMSVVSTSTVWAGLPWLRSNTRSAGGQDSALPSPRCAAPVKESRRLLSRFEGWRSRARAQPACASARARPGPAAFRRAGGASPACLLRGLLPSLTASAWLRGSASPAHSRQYFRPAQRAGFVSAACHLGNQALRSLRPCIVQLSYETRRTSSSESGVGCSRVGRWASWRRRGGSARRAVEQNRRRRRPKVHPPVGSPGLANAHYGGWGSPYSPRIRSGTSPTRFGCCCSNCLMIAARSAWVISATRIGSMSVVSTSTVSAGLVSSNTRSAARKDSALPSPRCAASDLIAAGASA
jgi:hypothetical protein